MAFNVKPSQVRPPPVFDIPSGGGAGIGETPAGAPEGIEAAPLKDPNFDPATNPLVVAVASGDIPGVIFTKEDTENPEAADLVENGRAVLALGLRLFTSQDGYALYNPSIISDEEIKKYDESGKLSLILSPAAQFLGGEKDKTKDSGVGGEAALAEVEGAPPGGAASLSEPISGNAQTQIASQRAQNSTVKPPTKRPLPAGGTLLNSLIQKPM